MTVGPSVRLSVVVVASTVLACAPRATPAQQSPSPPADSTQDMPPAGYGTLHQEDVALRLATETVQLRVLPLDERITRLLSPDSYESLHGLLVSRGPAIDSAAARSGAHRPRIFLVTFFGVSSNATFSPEDVAITSQNRLFRPVSILPMSAQWGELRLPQRETASAVYLFEEGITLSQPITLSYGGATSERWEATLRTLERERARVYARARGGSNP